MQDLPISKRDRSERYAELNLQFGRSSGLLSNLPFSIYEGKPGLKAWWRRRFQRKAWVYAGAFTEDWILAVAVADAGYVSNAFAYIYNRASRRFVEDKSLLPFGFARTFHPQLDATWAQRQGQSSFLIQPKSGGYEACYQGKDFSFAITFQPASPGLSALAPSPGRPFHHTYKMLSLPAEARLVFENKEHRISGPVGIIDYTAGYPGRHTFWNWAALTGRLDDGRELGLNLCAPFNDGLENGLWLDGELIFLDQARFEYSQPAESQNWKISTNDGLIELSFEPEGCRKEALNFGVLKSNFVQAFGRARGVLRLNGQSLPFNMFGVVEEHEALW